MTVDCVNGFCETGNACKLYHFPEGCTQKIFNLSHDPVEKANFVLLSRDRRSPQDPLGVCYGDSSEPGGGAYFEELSCELVRWCLASCQQNPDLPCAECCATQLCNQCERLDCATCLDAGSCLEVWEGFCLDCGG
jgi:hypothetical protein